jgi:hypothetical protein
MRLAEFYERERPKWSRLAPWLWVITAYVALLYTALRWGGGSAPVNILPSAD